MSAQDSQFSVRIFNSTELQLELIQGCRHTSLPPNDEMSVLVNPTDKVVIVAKGSRKPLLTPTLTPGHRYVIAIVYCELRMVEFPDNLPCPPLGKTSITFNSMITRPYNVWINKRKIIENTSGSVTVYARPGILTVIVSLTENATDGRVFVDNYPAGQKTSFFITDKMSYRVVDNLSLECDVVQSPFDPEKYSGKWWQIASIPQPYGLGCVRQTAEYAVTSPTTLSVFNQCLRNCKDVVRTIDGTATILNPEYPAALFVSFPGIPLPPNFNYIVHWVDPTYRVAVVGSGDRNSFYILYRKSCMKRRLYDQLLQMAKDLGYDVSKIVIDGDSVY